MKYGMLIHNLRAERGYTLSAVSDRVKTSRSILSMVEKSTAPPYCASFHERLMDVLRPSPEQRREIDRAWKREEVPHMTPRLVRQRAPIPPMPLGVLMDELDQVAEQVEELKPAPSKALAYSPGEKMHTFVGSVAEVRALALNVFGRVDPGTRTAIMITLDNTRGAT